MLLVEVEVAGRELNGGQGISGSVRKWLVPNNH